MHINIHIVLYLASWPVLALLADLSVPDLSWLLFLCLFTENMTNFHMVCRNIPKTIVLYLSWAKYIYSRF